eukprot:1137999-Pelagomonas_calceolata.AAC.7
MPLLYIQIVGVRYTVGCCGPRCGVVSAAYRMMGVISIASGRLEGYEGCAAPTHHHSLCPC